VPDSRISCFSLARSWRRSSGERPKIHRHGAMWTAQHSLPLHFISTWEAVTERIDRMLQMVGFATNVSMNTDSKRCTRSNRRSKRGGGNTIRRNNHIGPSKTCPRWSSAITIQTMARQRKSSLLHLWCNTLRKVKRDQRQKFSALPLGASPCPGSLCLPIATNQLFESWRMK
jgi:hypothetical protein